MSANSIGGFYVDLGLKADRDSFSKGKHSVEALTNSLSRLIGTVRNASAIVGAGIGTLTVASGKFESQQLLTAQALGINIKELNKWRVTATIANTDANGLINGIGALDVSITRMLKQGKSIEDIATNFSRLRHEAAKTNTEFDNISNQDFVNMAADQRALVIFRMAQALTDKKEAALYVRDMLGESGAQLFHYLTVSKQSIDDLLTKSGRLSFVDEESAQKALGFSTEFKTSLETLKSLSSLFGSELGGGLTPILERMNKYLSDHGPEIAQKITGIAGSITKITEALAPIVGGAIEKAIGLFGDLADTLASLVAGDWEKVGENLSQFFKNLASGINEAIFGTNKTQIKTGERVSGKYAGGNMFQKMKILENATPEQKIEIDNFEKTEKAFIRQINKDKSYIPFSKLTPDRISPETQALANQLIGMGVDLNIYKNKSNIDISSEAVDKLKNNYVPSIKDGVIRPNGQVTQVAPDDWVFAVRDIQDLGRAFLPNAVSYASAPQDITINQTINITSPTDWMPQTIKQQAFNGARDGLLQAITEGNRRIQLMPGTR